MASEYYYHHEQQEQAPVKQKKICVIRPPISGEAGIYVSRYFTKRQAPYDLARFNGWYPTAYDDVARVVIPCVSLIPGHKFWQARAVCDNLVNVKRYDSPSASRLDALVVCYPRTPPIKETTVVVEGPFDALAAAEVGYTGIGLMGCTPSDEVLNHLVTLLYGSKFVLIPDNGFKYPCMITAQKLATKNRYGSIIELPKEYKDLSEVPLIERQKLTF